MSKTIVSIGAGYVGVPTMAVCAEHCPEYNFICADSNNRLIDQLNSDHLPLYEPGLDSLVQKVRGINLHFTSDIDDAIRLAQIIFVSVCTPTKTYGLGANMACDLSYFESVARRIRDVSREYKVIVDKSTVPVGTGAHMKKILDSNQYEIKYDVISNPEFLAEGTAVRDLEIPNRVLIGCSPSDTCLFAVQEVVDLYQHWVDKDKIILTDRWSSELAKLTANAFLAQRVSSINSISALCEKAGGNIVDISKILGADPRIGKYFLNASVGFGGSCFHKDVMDLVYLCDYYNLHEVANYWRSVISINDYQKNRFVENIIHTMYDNIKNRHITIFGFSFKKDTGDTRESPAITVCQNLIRDGAILHIFDPKVPVERINEDLTGLSDHYMVENDPYQACVHSEALLILSAWDMFKMLDYAKIYASMDHPSYIFDGYNLLDRQSLQSNGFITYTIGINDKI